MRLIKVVVKKPTSVVPHLQGGLKTTLFLEHTWDVLILSSQVITGLYPKQCLCSIITMDVDKLTWLHSVAFTGQCNERKDNIFHLSCGNSHPNYHFWADRTAWSQASSAASSSAWLWFQAALQKLNYPATHPDFFSHSQLSQPCRYPRRGNRALLKDHSPEIPCRCATHLLRNTTEPTGGSDRGEAKVALKYPLLKK